METKKSSTLTPSGYSTVCPYLMVDNIEDQMKFLQVVFDAAIKENLQSPEGKTMHGEVIIGDTIIMIGRGNKNFPSRQGMNYVYVNNADEVYNKALQLGSSAVLSPADRFYGVREGGFKDPQGNTWWIAQFIKEVSVEDMEKGFAEVSK